MSLIAFHRFLITAGILFCGGYAFWEFNAGDASGFVLGTVFAILAVGLSVYLANLNRFLGHDAGSTRR